MELKLPQEFQNRIIQMLGDESGSFFASYSKPRCQALRVNPLKISPEEFRHLVSFHLTPVPWADGCFYYAVEDHPGKNPLHEAGLYYIQEPSAMIVGALSGVQPGEHVLDLCAAPGGKSTHLAGLMHGKGLLVSNEIHPQRAKVLSGNIERFGIRNTVVTNETPEHLAEHFPSYFDRIVVDAPCSGEGMFRKEEAALTNWSPENVTMCAKRQKDILSAADTMLRPGGTLVYSTCTFSMEENEDNIKWFLENHPDYIQKSIPDIIGRDLIASGLSAGFDGKSLRLWPHKVNGEGHFLAMLQKNGISYVDPNQPQKIEKQYQNRKKAKRSASHSGTGRTADTISIRDLRKVWSDFSEDTLTENAAGLFDPSSSAYTFFGDELYLLPEKLSLKNLKVLRPGLHLGTMKKNRFEPSHSLALALNQKDLKHTLDFTDHSAEIPAYLHGESLPCAQKGWTAVTVDGYPLGWGKASGGILKNHYPKGLRTLF